MRSKRSQTMENIVSLPDVPTLILNSNDTFEADVTLLAQTLMDFLDHTIDVWQPYTDRPLTREDARQIAQNVSGFFRILREWAEEERTAAASVACAPDMDSMKNHKFEASSQKKRRRKTAAARV
jgi:hypothetical protein